MNDLDASYRDASSELDIPIEQIHALKPAELQVLSYLAANRDRIVAQPELALEVFGESSMQARKRVSALTSSVRRVLRRRVRLKPTFTRYRGQLAAGLRWQPLENPGDSSATGTTPEQTAS